MVAKKRRRVSLIGNPPVDVTIQGSAAAGGFNSPGGGVTQQHLWQQEPSSCLQVEGVAQEHSHVHLVQCFTVLEFRASVALLLCPAGACAAAASASVSPDRRCCS